jgi:hypothetical protein
MILSFIDDLIFHRGIRFIHLVVTFMLKANLFTVHPKRNPSPCTDVRKKARVTGELKICWNKIARNGV